MDRKDKNENTGGVDFLAKVMGVGASTIYSAMRRGDPLPPCLQIGTRKVWRLETIEKWIADNEAPPSPDPRATEKGAKGGRPRTQVRKSQPSKRMGRPTKRQQIERRMGGGEA